MGAPSKEAQALKAGLNARIAQARDLLAKIDGDIEIAERNIRSQKAYQDAIRGTVTADEALLVSCKPQKARAPKKDTPDA